MDNMKQKIYKNGTPYSDESWKNWYAHKSSKEIFIEWEEREQERLEEAKEDLT